MSRRHFLRGASALGAAALLGYASVVRAEPPPETRRIRLVLSEAMCMAPQYLADEMLRAEGFDLIEYVPIRAASGTYSSIWIPDMIADGVADLSMSAVPGLLAAVDRGAPLTMLGGIHAGCYELFGRGDVRSIRDLKGRKVAAAKAGDERLFISAMMSYVGLDAATQVQWIDVGSLDEAMRLFIDGNIDAFLGFPPQPQELRARKIGRMFLSTAADKPWSQYFCCMIAANQRFVEKYPVATKRAMRAILKAADVCSLQPEQAAKFMVDKGYVSDMTFALGLMKDLPYDRWRSANPEDTVRFYSLRLHEIGLLKNNAQKIIAQGTNWRFLNKLKKELKA